MSHTTYDQIAEAAGLAPDQLVLMNAIARVIDDAVARHTEPLADEVARLRHRIQRPDLVKYSVEEAAARLGRSRSSLYELMKAGEIVPVKERGRTFVTEEEVQRWERAQRT